MRLKPLGLSLTGKVAVLSLVPIVALGFLLARVLQAQIVTRSLQDAGQSAALLARIGIQPRITPHDLRYGVSAVGIRSLDEQLSERSASEDLARIKIWNPEHRIIYSDDHLLIGRVIAPSDDLRDAFAGAPDPAEVVTPNPHDETASEVGLGQLVEVYVPLRFSATGPPAGVFEIYLSYRPVAAAIASDKRSIALLVAGGLALLWAILFRIVATASRTLRRQAEENDHLARYDQLTGLPNRTLFIERAAEEFASWRAGRKGTVAVLLLDVDGFKEINDTLGHPNGDAVLNEIARRLGSETIAPGAIVARLGADEYGILLTGGGDAAEAPLVAASVQSRLEEPIRIGGVALNVELSIGLALVPEHAESLPELLQHADVALERAKAHRSRVEIYSADHDDFSTARLALLGEVRPGLERGEFVLHFQPKIDLASGRTTGVEALVRWQHPEHGMLAPIHFIPLIEQTALVGPLTLHVVDRALEQAAIWHHLGFELNMSVNLSARNLLDLELPAQIEALLTRYDVDPCGLTVEVTESATMTDPDRAVRVLAALRSMGVRVSIDDFGTGHASFAYLTGLPATEIKIDRSFVTGMCESERDEAIVRSTLDLARNLDLRVVAEGIETTEVSDRLKEMGCASGQGYLISKPMAGEQLTGWLLEGFEQAPAVRSSGAPTPRARAGSATKTLPAARESVTSPRDRTR